MKTNDHVVSNSQNKEECWPRLQLHTHTTWINQRQKSREETSFPPSLWKARCVCVFFHMWLTHYYHTRGFERVGLTSSSHMSCGVVLCSLCTAFSGRLGLWKTPLSSGIDKNYIWAGFKEAVIRILFPNNLYSSSEDFSFLSFVSWDMVSKSMLAFNSLRDPDWLQSQEQLVKVKITTPSWTQAREQGPNGQYCNCRNLWPRRWPRPFFKDELLIYL